MSYNSDDIIKWLKLLVQCHRFIRSHPNKEMKGLQLQVIQTEWLSLMSSDLSIEADEHDEVDKNMSCTDVLFSVLCYTHCSSSLNTRNIYIHDSMVDLIVDVTIMACRHETTKYKKAIQIHDMRMLFQRVASFVCRYACVPQEVLIKSMNFTYPMSHKEEFIKELIELPHYSRYTKPKVARQPETYEELEEIELIQRVKKMELEKKMNQDTEMADVSKSTHIFQFEDSHHEQDTAHEDGNDRYKDDEHEETQNSGKTNHSELLQLSLKSIQEIIHTQTSSSSSSSSSSSTQASVESPLIYERNEFAKKLEHKIIESRNKSPLAASSSLIPGANRGDLWLLYKDVIASSFVSTFNHIFYGAFTEASVIESCTHIQNMYETDLPVYRERFYTWLYNHCLIDSNDDFMPRYRFMCQERLLPMGLRSRRYRREATAHIIEQGMELMQDYLGIATSTVLHDVVYAKKLDVSKDKTHPCFESLCITQFAYMLEHGCRDKTFKFNGVIYIQPTDLSTEKLKWIKQTMQWGYPRPPIIVEALNRFFVNFVKRCEKTDEYKIYMTECTDMVHAILTWVKIFHLEYKSILRFSVAVDLSDWYQEFFVEKKKKMTFAEMLNCKK